MFKKITAIGASVLMVGMTMGVAAAASFPAPFNGKAATQVAVVTGSGSGVDDSVAAGDISSYLAARVTGGSDVVATGGDSWKMEKSSNNFNLGDDAADIYASLDKDELPILLADGTYSDDLNADYSYTQKITFGSSLDLTHFSDTDYDELIGAASRTPVIGIKFGTGDTLVLNYTWDLTTHPTYDAATLETTTMKLMGKDYYVLDVLSGTTNKTTLLDSANTAVVAEGESATVAGVDISINFINSNEVKLDAGGEITNSLGEGATYKLSDGTYIGIKDILFNSKESGISKVEISVGKGKLELTHGLEIEINDVTVNEITAFLVQDSSEKTGQDCSFLGD